MLGGCIASSSSLVFHLSREIARELKHGAAFHKWTIGPNTCQLSFYLNNLFMIFKIADYDGEQIATGIQPSRDVRLVRCVYSRLWSILAWLFCVGLWIDVPLAPPDRYSNIYLHKINQGTYLLSASWSYLPHIKQILLKTRLIWALARTGTMTTSHGFFP